ncbi:MAG: peptidase [Bacteroidia bacterium]
MKINKSFTLIVSISLFFTIFLTECKKDDPDKKAAFAHDLLSGDKFDKLIVEVQYMAGSQPTTGTLDNLKTFLEQRLNKTGGITFVETAIAAQGKATYSFADIQAIEKANKAQSGNGSTLTTYFLFVDGDYSENSGSSKILGIAYGTSSMAIFEKTIKEFSGGIGKPSATTLETTVINHEFGHTLGLVNNGTDMATSHQDEPNGKHCNNKDCLMYYTAETSDIIGNLLGNNIPGLDANCINDLKANGGK